MYLRKSLSWTSLCDYNIVIINNESADDNFSLLKHSITLFS